MRRALKQPSRLRRAAFGRALWPAAPLWFMLTALITGCPNEPAAPARPDLGGEADQGLQDMRDERDQRQPLDMGEELGADLGADQGQPDMAKPTGLRVLELTPEQGGELEPEGVVRLRFDRPITRQGARAMAVHGPCQGALQLERQDTGRCVAARTRQVDDRTLELIPRQALWRGASYTVRVLAQQAVAVDGTTLEQTYSATLSVKGHEQPAYARVVDMEAPMPFEAQERVASSDGKPLHVSWDEEHLYIGISQEDMTVTNMALYVVVGAMRDQESPGAAMVPAERWFEGSMMLLPFHASHLFMAKTVNGQPEPWMRQWSGVTWGPRQEASQVMTVRLGQEHTRVAIKRQALGQARELDVAIYLKNLASANNGQLPGWGWTFGSSDPSFEQGYGDRVMSTSLRLDLSSPQPPSQAPLTRRFGREVTRTRIYQLLMRTFSNTNETRQPNGTLAQNGVGTFDDLNEAALTALVQMGFSHVWLTGVLQQATSTDWSGVGQPPDDPDILKGRAGSPYAVRDYFDVSPDYARDPAKRLETFEQTVARMHDAGLKVIIDVVPNHVARSYQTDVAPELTFGLGDDRDVFYAPDNHFFYLQQGQPPLLMPGHDRAQTALSPTCQILQGQDPEYQCDGVYDWMGRGEMDFGRVTGNNVASWSPSIDSWYETVKLNYGFDYTTGRADHPLHGQPERPIPRTWLILDAIIAHWQGLGVDGFRADMVHMVPMELQGWLIARSRARNPDVFWVAEAYDTDPAKVVSGNVLHALLGAGYDAVYDDATYDKLKEVFDGSAWLNDLDGVLGGDPILVHHALRYAENHDEVRLASRWDWRFEGQNVGLTIGPAVTALLHGLGQGPTMVFAGQETGEPAAQAEGFGGDDGRTTIFDYWSMPTFTGWVNGLRYDGGGLDEATRALRARYIELLKALEHPILERGQLFRLNAANVGHAAFGRAPDEQASGHYSYAYLRMIEGQAVLVYAWLHPTQAAPDVSVRIPQAAWSAAQLPAQVTLEARLGELGPQAQVSAEQAAEQGVALGTVGPGQVRVIVLR